MCLPAALAWLHFRPRHSALRMFRPLPVKKTHPPGAAGTFSLSRCRRLRWGHCWRKEEPALFFSTGPKLLMDALPKSLHTHTHTQKLGSVCGAVGGVRLYANALACGHALSARQTRRLKHNSCVLKKTYLFEQPLFFFFFFLHFTVEATRHYCQVMSETDSSLVSAALSIKTWCVSSLGRECLRTS